MIRIAGIVVATILVCVAGGFSDADSPGRYRMLSYEGAPITVTLHDDFMERMLMVECGSAGRLCFPDFVGWDGVGVPQGRFLELRYGVRCGTNQSATEYTLLCVFKGKLRVVLFGTVYDHVSEPAWNCKEGTPNSDLEWNTNYRLRLRDGQYSMLVSEYHWVKSVCEPKRNTRVWDTFSLKFDTAVGVFCSSYDTLSGELYETEDSKPVRIDHIVCPAVKGETAGERDYSYFINGYWYIEGEKGKYYQVDWQECE